MGTTGRDVLIFSHKILSLYVWNVPQYMLIWSGCVIILSLHIRIQCSAVCLQCRPRGRNKGKAQSTQTFNSEPTLTHIQIFICGGAISLLGEYSCIHVHMTRFSCAQTPCSCISPLKPDSTTTGIATSAFYSAVCSRYMLTKYFR